MDAASVAARLNAVGVTDPNEEHAHTQTAMAEANTTRPRVRGTRFVLQCSSGCPAGHADRHRALRPLPSPKTAAKIACRWQCESARRRSSRCPERMRTPLRAGLHHRFGDDVPDEQPTDCDRKDADDHVQRSHSQCEYRLARALALSELQP